MKKLLPLFVLFVLVGCKSEWEKRVAEIETALDKEIDVPGEVRYVSNNEYFNRDLFSNDRVYLPWSGIDNETDQQILLNSDLLYVKYSYYKDYTDTSFVNVKRVFKFENPSLEYVELENRRKDSLILFKNIET